MVYVIVSNYMIYLLTISSFSTEICRTHRRALQTVSNSKKMSVNDRHKHLITYLYYRIKMHTQCGKTCTQTHTLKSNAKNAHKIYKASNQSTSFMLSTYKCTGCGTSPSYWIYTRTEPLQKTC